MVTRWVGKTVFTLCVVTMLCPAPNTIGGLRSRGCLSLMVVAIHGTGLLKHNLGARLVASLIGNDVKRHDHIFSNTWLFESLCFVDAVDVPLVIC